MVNKKKKKMFLGVQVFVACHSVLQLSQLLVSGYMKSSISTIERRYGLSSQKSGLLAAFNEVGANRLVVRSFSSLGREKVCRAARPDGGPPRPAPGGRVFQVGNTLLIVFVSFLGSRVHRPRAIGCGALLACLASLLMALPHFLSGPYRYGGRRYHGGDRAGGESQAQGWREYSSTRLSRFFPRSRLERLGPVPPGEYSGRGAVVQSELRRTGKLRPRGRLPSAAMRSAAAGRGLRAHAAFRHLLHRRPRQQEELAALPRFAAAAAITDRVAVPAPA